MSKPQKLKKQKNGMSMEARATLGNAFKGIISNQCCVDGGKEGPWWVACIFLVLSVMLPLIPVMVTQSKTAGSNILGSYNYDIDKGVHNTFTSAKNAGYSFNVNNGLLSFSPSTPVSNPEVPFQKDLYNMDGHDVYNFFLYITDYTGSELQEFVTKITEVKYENGTLNPYDPAKAEQYATDGTTFYTPSFLVLAPNTMALAVYKKETTTLATSSYGGLTWNHTPNGNLITLELGENKTETYNNFRGLLDQTYLDQKAITFRNNVLIYFGVYVGLILFLGVLVFILTRGKNNMFSFLTFFQCQKITWWAAFTPAVLGMIFAFIFSTNMIGQMSFVVFLALRIMWLSMRQLRPVQ